MRSSELSRSIQAVIEGSKGDKERKAVESPDSLFSIAHARIVDLISEGEIEGFVHGADFLRDVYFDETPIQNADGTRNFKNLQVDARTGTQNQSYIPGFPAVENELAVGLELKFATPWTRSFTNKSLSAVRVRLGVQSLSAGDSETGDVKGTTVQYAMDIATDGGAFVEVMRSAMTGKSSGPYERGHRLELPKSTVSGWIIRVRRLTADSTTQYLNNKSSIVSCTEIIDGKFRYPMSAVVGIQVDSSQFPNIPTRAFHVRGRKIRVPANYDPSTRTYATTGTGTSGGAWDGTFKTVYSNNPAWVFYDMTTHRRYGLGKLVDELVIDKWSLYAIGQYCDETVPDGFGGTEPRMTCNLYLQKAADAWKVIGDLSSIFRGICYWAGGSVVPVADRPSDPVYTYTNANVVGGAFQYQSTGRRARHTAVIVSYNDMTDFCRLKSDYYDDPEGIARFGFQLAEVSAMGCTSRGQAQRFAKWLLYTEKLLTNTVAFAVGVDGTYGAPGQIIRIADKHRAGRRIGGRVRSATASNVVLDRMPEVAPMAGDTLIVTLPEGYTESRVVSSVVGEGVNVSVPFTAIPVPESVWAVESSDLSTQLFRLLGTEKSDDGGYSMVAMQHNPSIFDAVDLGEAISVPPTSVIPSPAQMRPLSITITSAERAGQVIAMPLLSAAWPAATGAVKYKIQWQKDNGDWTAPQEVSGTSADYQTPFPGVYVAKVEAVNAIGVTSVPQYSTPYTLTDQSMTPGFVDQLNQDITTALGTAQNAQATADGVVEFFWQDAMPVIGAGAGQAKVGDFWVDTNDGNHLWRVVGTQWVDAQDDEIGNALIAAQTAQGTADGKVTTFFKATAPTNADAPVGIGSLKLGDLWFNTTDKKLFRWNGVNWNSEIADVTLDQLGGSGVNIMQERHTRFFSTELPPLSNSVSTLYIVAEPLAIGGAYALRALTNGVIVSQDFSYFGVNAADKNFDVAPGDYILSFYARADVTGHTILPAITFDAGATAYPSGSSSNTVALTLARARYSVKITVPAGASRANLLMYWNRAGVAGRSVTIDGLMIERMIGRKVEASAWSPGQAGKLAIDAITAASAAQDTADGKIETYLQTSMPAGTLGDLWFDTDDGNKMYRHNGTTYVLAQDTAIGDAIVAAAGAQATADGKITTFYSATAPAGTKALGDLWYNTTDKNLSRWNGSVWVIVGDITTDKLAGSGVNLLWDEYTHFKESLTISAASNPAMNTSGLAQIILVADATAVSGYSLRVLTGTGATQYVRFAPDATTSNIKVRRKKYLMSFYAKSDTSGHQIKPFLRGDASVNGAVVALTGAYQRFTQVYDLTGLATPEGEVNLGVFASTADTSGVYVYFDRIMFEEMVGSVEDASTWVAGPSGKQTLIAIANAAYAQATADGKITLFKSPSPPASGFSEGDIWIDTDTNVMHVREGVAWVVRQDSQIGQALNNAATAQATADGKVTTFYQTTTPTAEAVGDLWYNKNTMELKRWSGSAWVGADNAPTGGAGENMLSNPDFTRNKSGTVSNGLPAVGDPLSDGWYCYQQSARADSDVRWYDTGLIRLRCYGTEPLANGATVIVSARMLETFAVEEGRTYRFSFTSVNSSFNGTIPSGVNIRSRLTVRTYDSAGAQISYAEVATGSRANGTYSGTYTVPVGSGVAKMSLQIEGLVQNTSGASWTHNSTVAFNTYIKQVSMVKVANMDNEVQDGTDYGRPYMGDLYMYGGYRRVGMRVPGSGHRIGDQRNLPQSNTTAYGSVRTVAALSATSSGTVTVNAHTVRYGGVSIAYSAVTNAVTGLTVGNTYVIYCFDDAYAGGVRTWLAGANPAAVMALGDGIVVAGQITIPASGGSTGGGGGGGGDPGEWCVDYDTMLPDGRYLRDLRLGDLVECIDVRTGETGMFPLLAMGFGEEDCYRLVTKELHSVIQSKSTPMDLPDGRVLLTPHMFGRPVYATINGTPTLTTVADLEYLGLRRVIKPDFGDRMFFAGESADKCLATHNAIQKP